MLSQYEALKDDIVALCALPKGVQDIPLIQYAKERILQCELFTLSEQRLLPVRAWIPAYKLMLRYYSTTNI